MNRKALVERTQANLRDFQLTAFREIDIIRFINEGVDRVVQIIPQFETMEHLEYDEQIPICLPKAYHHLLATYSSSKLFAQDERFYQATTAMNEFEQKLFNLYDNLTSGEVKAYDKNGLPISFGSSAEYVSNNYYANKSGVHAFDWSDE